MESVDGAYVVVAMTPVVVGTYNATYLSRFVPINGSMLIMLRHAGDGWNSLQIYSFE